jgi:hypothetical protein
MRGPEQRTSIAAPSQTQNNLQQQFAGLGQQQAGLFNVNTGMNDPRAALAYLDSYRDGGNAKTSGDLSRLAAAVTGGQMFTSNDQVAKFLSNWDPELLHKVGQNFDGNGGSAGLLNLAQQYGGTSPYAGLEKYDTPEVRAELKRLTEQQDMSDRIGRDANDALLMNLKGEITSGQETALRNAQEYGRTTGMEDLRMQAQQMAGNRGLRTTDTPVARELLLAQERLGLGLASDYSKGYLNTLDSNRNFAQGLRSFQQGLQQQGFSNRQALSGANPAASSMLFGADMERQLATKKINNEYGGLDYVDSGSKMISGIGQMGAGFTGGGKCWIAEAIYGKDAMETHVLRAYLNGPFDQAWYGKPIMALYGKYGQRIARQPWACRLLKPLFELALTKAVQHFSAEMA